MHDIAFFEKKTDYMDFLHNEIFVEDWVWESDFYRGLINFVADTRAPLFYEISDPSEHFAFSGAYHFETRRQRYPNKTREILFWLHDFTHMLFPYAHDLWIFSEEAFLAQFRYQEWIASTETEVFAYYRVPGLREKVFPDEKLYYDVMRECGWHRYRSAQTGRYEYMYDGQEKPNADVFLTHRRKLVMDDGYAECELGYQHGAIRQFFQKWRTLTPKWVNQRYRSMAGKRIPMRDLVYLNVNNYERVLRDWETESSQENYEHNVLNNLQVAYAILELEDPPQRFRHCGDAINELEGAVLFK